jgi:hypothetical protein
MLAIQFDISISIWHMNKEWIPLKISKKIRKYEIKIRIMEKLNINFNIY